MYKSSLAPIYARAHACFLPPAPTYRIEHLSCVGIIPVERFGTEKTFFYPLAAQKDIWGCVPDAPPNVGVDFWDAQEAFWRIFPRFSTFTPVYPQFFRVYPQLTQNSHNQNNFDTPDCITLTPHCWGVKRGIQPRKGGRMDDCRQRKRIGSDQRQLIFFSRSKKSLPNQTGRLFFFLQCKPGAHGFDPQPNRGVFPGAKPVRVTGSVPG